MRFETWGSKLVWSNFGPDRLFSCQKGDEKVSAGEESASGSESSSPLLPFRLTPSLSTAAALKHKLYALSVPARTAPYTVRAKLVGSLDAPLIFEVAWDGPEAIYP